MGELMGSIATTPPSNGACVGKPVDMWFPNLNVYEASLEEIRMGRKNMKEALQICSTCDVRVQCLEYALSWERHGIWGGTSESERESMRRKNNIPFLRPSIQELGLGFNRATTH